MLFGVHVIRTIICFMLNDYLFGQFFFFLLEKNVMIPDFFYNEFAEYVLGVLLFLPFRVSFVIFCHIVSSIKVSYTASKLKIILL